MGYHSGPASATPTEQDNNLPSTNNIASACLLLSVEGIEWDATMKVTINYASVQLAEACWASQQVNLPLDMTEARIEAEHVLLVNIHRS